MRGNTLEQAIADFQDGMPGYLPRQRALVARYCHDFPQTVRTYRRLLEALFRADPA